MERSFTYFLFVFSAVLFPLSASAYQVQVSTGYQETRLERSKSPSDSDTASAAVGVYFKALEDEGRPWRLLPFLDRASLVAVQHQQVKYPNDFFEETRKANGVAAEVQVGQTPLRLGAGYTQFETGSDSVFQQDDDFDETRYLVGWYLFENGLIAYTGAELDREVFAIDRSESAWSVDYRHALEVGNSSWLEFTLGTGEREIKNVASGPAIGTLEIERHGIGVTYYPAQFFGIGLQLARQSEAFASGGEDFDSQDARLVLNIDPVETFGLQIFYNDRTTDDALVAAPFLTEVDFDTQTIGAQLDFRF